MSDHEVQQEKTQGRFGLSAEEYADVKTMLKMAGAIFGAVALALIIVSTGSTLLTSLFG